ncbi:MAG: hypothetical protein ACM31E_05705, partial [Fibrobacterota bacterium]|nr:hypothetical protein [Chitinispirillaceae bacterium]
MKRKYAGLLIVSLIISAISSELDPLLQSKHCMNSAAVKALGDATIANPDDILSGLHNPALVYAYFAQKKASKVSIVAGYSRDSLFDKHVIPSGIAYGNKEGAIGGFYRGLLTESGMQQHEAIINLSGMLAAPLIDETGYEAMGQVDFGVNIRYVWYNWDSRVLTPSDTTLKPISNAEIKQTRLLFDIGLYQGDVSPNLDFALTLRNVFGYVWQKENPVIKDSIAVTVINTADTIKDTVSSYTYNDEKSKGWIKNEYRALTIGIVYHVNKNSQSWQLHLPIDFEILGMFNKKVKNQYIFRGGIEATIRDNFSVRLGYSRAPGPIQSGWKEIKKMNIFTGG